MKRIVAHPDWGRKWGCRFGGGLTGVVYWVAEKFSTLQQFVPAADQSTFRDLM